MTNPQNSVSSWLAAMTALLLLGACTSGTANTPSSKSASDESAVGSEQPDAKGSATSKKDIAEDEETDEVAKPEKKGSSEEPKEKAGKGPVDDSRTTETLHELVKKNRAKFKKCYEVERAKAPDMKGSVVLELTLDGDGKIKTIGINADESTLKVKAINDCIVSVAQSIAWPPSSKGLNKDFRYEFGFNNK